MSQHDMDSINLTRKTMFSKMESDLGVKGLRFKLHGNNHGNHLEHYGIHHDNHGNHHGVIITVIKVIELLQSEVGLKILAIFVYFIYNSL